MAASDAEACGAVAAAADIICSLRAADLAGWTPPWSRTPAAREDVEKKEEELAWPAVARGKRSRSRSRRRSPSGSGSAAKGRWARGSPASPLDYSGGSGSGASTSGGEDGGFCSPPAALAVGHRHAGPTAAPASSAKVGSAGGRRRPSILPVPPPRSGGQRSRKKMRLPEVQQLVRSLTVENVGLREEMESLQRACTALSKENGKLETRLRYSSSKRTIRPEEEQQRKARVDQHAAEQDDRNGFVLPDLNLPVQDIADGSAAP